MGSSVDKEQKPVSTKLIKYLAIVLTACGIVANCYNIIILSVQSEWMVLTDATRRRERLSNSDVVTSRSATVQQVQETAEEER